MSLDRILAEQRRAAAYLAEHGPDAPKSRGAALGVSDWMHEEVERHGGEYAAPLKAPFTYFGGKSRVAHLVWERFGNVPNYVEPFAGSLAVLLSRPHPPQTETVNDKDAMIANFWRALAHDPDEVARFADWPVNEADLHARHRWLVNQTEFRERMLTDPDYYDAKIAGWWAWGISQWIGSGWCVATYQKRPHLGNSGTGVHRQLPHLGDSGTGPVYEWFRSLAARLRKVRVCCGDWKRVLGPSVTFKHGTTGIFLDPPYSAEADRSDVYAAEDFSVAHEVREWAIANGDNPMLRIALCGYEGEHEMPASWDCVAWKAHGGYGSQGSGRGRENAGRERIWFSLHCLAGRQASLFDTAADCAVAGSATDSVGAGFPSTDCVGGGCE